MTTVDDSRLSEPATAARPSGSGHSVGVGLMLTSAASNQTGAALGAQAFPSIGTVGVVAVRQLVTALVLVPIVRPRIRSLRREHWSPILGLALVFSVMNLSLYAAVDRIGLGLAVTLEFLGPLTVAIVSSRRAPDIAGAVIAAAGVVILTSPGPATDVGGTGLALLAGAAWGCYILLNRTLGRRLPGLEGTATASLVSATAWAPIAAAWFAVNPPTATALVLAVACGLLASIVPYVADLLALRRVPAHVYGTFASTNPVWAAVAGWILLDQTLDGPQWLGIGLIVTSNVVVTRRAFAGGRPPQAHRRPALSDHCTTIDARAGSAPPRRAPLPALLAAPGRGRSAALTDAAAGAPSPGTER